MQRLITIAVAAMAVAACGSDDAVSKRGGTGAIRGSKPR
jgi:hypothetical protein